MSVRTPHPTKGPGWHQIDIGYGKDRVTYAFKGTREAALNQHDHDRRKRGKVVIKADPRLREIIADYLSEYQIDHLSGGYEKLKMTLDKVVDYFGAYNLTSISPTMIDQYKRERMLKVKPITINKELSALSGCLKWAVEKQYLHQIPRIKRFPPKLAKSPMKRIPTPEIMEKIIQESVPRLRELFRLSFMAGLRPGEAAGLKSENWIADLNILAVTGKGNKTRHIPIVNPEMQAELTRRAKETKSGYLWESPWTKGRYVDIRGALKEAAKRAGWNESINPHLLRHAAATDLIGKGVDVSIVQQILGHSTIKVTETYLHIQHGMMRDAMHKKNHSHDM